MVGIATLRLEWSGTDGDEPSALASRRAKERIGFPHRTKHPRELLSAARRITLPANPELDRASAIPPAIVLIMVRRLIRAIVFSQLVWVIWCLERFKLARRSVRRLTLYLQFKRKNDSLY